MLGPFDGMFGTDNLDKVATIALEMCLLEELEKKITADDQSVDWFDYEES